jgi:hypothetical protein
VTRAVDRLFGGTANQLPIYLRWQDEAAHGQPIAGRSIGVDLSTLEPGRHRLSISAQVSAYRP